jgi:hypothetical protein
MRCTNNENVGTGLCVVTNISIMYYVSIKTNLLCRHLFYDFIILYVYILEMALAIHYIAMNLILVHSLLQM